MRTNVKSKGFRRHEYVGLIGLNVPSSMLSNLHIYIVLWLRQVMKNIGIHIHWFAGEMQHASTATFHEVSGCCKLLLMFCEKAYYKLASCTLHNTALLC